MPLPDHHRLDLLFEGIWGKLVPTRVNAETIGLRVDRVAYRLQTWRVQPGDVLLSANTVGLTSFENFELFVQKLREESRLELILIRGQRLLRLAGPIDESEGPISLLEIGRAH